MNFLEALKENETKRVRRLSLSKTPGMEYICWFEIGEMKQCKWGVPNIIDETWESEEIPKTITFECKWVIEIVGDCGSAIGPDFYDNPSLEKDLRKLVNNKRWKVTCEEIK